MGLKTLKDHGLKILQGNEACAEGALAAECKFFAGYPITPASEIPEYLSSRIFEEGGRYVQMEDELASICAVIGARWGGVRSMTATSGPGFTLVQEAIGYAIVTESPIVIADIMRGGPSTGQPTFPSQQDVMQAKYGSHGDYELIALAPSSVQEMFDFTVRAFNLADQFRVPVLVMGDEVLGHMREKIVVPEQVEIFDYSYEGITRTYYRPDEDLIPPRISFYQGHSVLLDGQLHDERGVRAGHLPDACAAAVRRYCDKILKNADKITDVKRYYEEDMDIAVVAYGTVARSALSAVNAARKDGLKVGLLKVNSLWPFPEKEIESFCKGAKKVLVPEMNVGQYVREVARVAGKEKVVSMPSLGGLLHTPKAILGKIKEILA